MQARIASLEGKIAGKEHRKGKDADAPRRIGVGGPLEAESAAEPVSLSKSSKSSKRTLAEAESAEEPVSLSKSSKRDSKGDSKSNSKRDSERDSEVTLPSPADAESAAEPAAATKFSKNSKMALPSTADASRGKSAAGVCPPHMTRALGIGLL